MKQHRLSRREMVESCITKGLLVAAVPVSQSKLLAFWEESETRANKRAFTPTPVEVLGPFFRKGAPDQSILRHPGDAGFPLHVSGNVVNTKGERVEGARVDVWHADHYGKYDVSGYRYRTKISPDAKGLYAIETVMPGHYADRPAQHIHYLISAPGHKTLVTQLYFATDPFFEGDPDRNYRKRSIVDNRELVKPVMLYEGPEAHASVVFDLVLEGA